MEDLTVAQLKAIASTRGVSLSGFTRKEDIIAFLKVASLPSPPVRDSDRLTANTSRIELRTKTIPELRAMAAASGVSLVGIRLKADIISALVVATSPIPPAHRPK